MIRQSQISEMIDLSSFNTFNFPYLINMSDLVRLLIVILLFNSSKNLVTFVSEKLVAEYLRSIFLFILYLIEKYNDNVLLGFVPLVII